MSRRVEDIDDDDLRSIADTLRGALRTIAASDERLVIRLADVDWPAIQQLAIEDLAITPDIIRDALSLFRLTNTATSAQQPRKWWRELALALLNVHDAVAAELARRGR